MMPMLDHLKLSQRLLIPSWGGRGSQKRGNGICLSWCKTLQFLPVYHWCLSSCYSSAGAQREWFWVSESICGFFKRNCLGLQQFLLPIQSLLVFVARSCGTLGCGAWYGSGTPPDIPPEFLSDTCGCGTCLCHICAPPTSLGGCGFFSLIVVILPFNLISDGSEWWLFYILVVNLMWLCEGASHVCLCCHLDWKSL